MQRGPYWHVRFTHAGKRWSVSTGTGDFARAKELAPKIYAEAVTAENTSTTRLQRELGTFRADRDPLDVAVARWIHSLEGRLDPATIHTYQQAYSSKWLVRWASLEAVDALATSAFVAERLRQVTASSARKEASALRSFLSFAFGDRAPPVPSIPKRALGTRKLRPAKSIIVEPKLLQRAIDALPEWSKPRLGVRHPIRARIVIQYETGLRREAVSLLEWADVRGNVLEIRDEVDKVRLGRELPLSARAVAALAGLPKKPGPIFGSHDYRWAMARLAAAVGVPVVHLRALRHNRGSHLANAGVALPAIQYLLGHKHVSTTAIYLHANKDAAFAAVQGKPGRKPRT